MIWRCARTAVRFFNEPSGTARFGSFSSTRTRTQPFGRIRDWIAWDNCGVGLPAIEGASLDSNTTNAERTATNIPAGTAEDLRLIVSAPAHALHTRATAHLRNGCAGFANACQILGSEGLAATARETDAGTGRSGELSHDSN